jgi:signal transduction histidine kinase
MSMTKGAGLGLAIAKEIIRMHGAKVAVKSVIGQGTSFIITFPPDKVVHVS